MKILVTGHNGFIGKHVVDLLKKSGHIVSVVAVPMCSIYPEEFQRAVACSEVIIHLAGKNRAPDYELYTTNILLTMSLIDAVVKYNPQAHLVFASSFHVYFEKSLYGASKKACENILSVYARRNGIRSTVLRLSNVYGPGCKPFYNSVIATYIYQAMHELPIQVNRNGSQLRDYIYISDVARAFLAAITHSPDRDMAIYDICTGKQVSLNDIITHIDKISGKKSNITRSDNPELPELPVIKPTTANRVIGWKPIVSLEEGIRHILTVEYEHISTKA
jgi:nucleoside-diphosphate-sugar epimerase